MAVVVVVVVVVGDCRRWGKGRARDADGATGQIKVGPGLGGKEEGVGVARPWRATAWRYTYRHLGGLELHALRAARPLPHPPLRCPLAPHCPPHYTPTAMWSRLHSKPTHVCRGRPAAA